MHKDTKTFFTHKLVVWVGRGKTPNGEEVEQRDNGADDAE
jgi:hypothetical protein